MVCMVVLLKEVNKTKCTTTLPLALQTGRSKTFLLFSGDFFMIFILIAAIDLQDKP